MRTILSILTILLIVVSTPSAKEKKWKNKKNKKKNKTTVVAKVKQEVEIPVNVGLGPAMFILPAPFEGLHWGAQFQIYAAISPELVQANKHKIPKEYRKYAKMISGETRVRPFPLSIMPDAFIISPRDDSKGKKDEAYGVIWSSMFGLGILGFGEAQDFLSFRLGLGLPSLMYIYGGSYRFVDNNQHIVGVGADAYSFIDMRMSPKFHISFSARSQAYLTNTLKYLDENKEEVESNFFPMHRFAVTLNYRFGYKTKI